MQIYISFTYAMILKPVYLSYLYNNTAKLWFIRRAALDINAEKSLADIYPLVVYYFCKRRL